MFQRSFIDYKNDESKPKGIKSHFYIIQSRQNCDFKNQQLKNRSSFSIARELCTYMHWKPESMLFTIKIFLLISISAVNVFTTTLYENCDFFLLPGNTPARSATIEQQLTFPKKTGLFYTPPHRTHWLVSMLDYFLFPKLNLWSKRNHYDTMSDTYWTS